MAINKVGSKGIVDCSVAAADFAPGTITSAKISDCAVTNAKLSNSSLTASGTSIALGASGTLNNAFIDWQSKVTSDGSTVTTMVAGRGYFIDNSSAAGIVKLPASASIGDMVVIKDYAGNFGTNKLTIQRNGHNIQGVANESEISTNRASVVLVYVDATKGWLYTDEHNVADLQNLAFISATGGTVTTSGDFKIHTFTGDGNFVVSQGNIGPGTTLDYLVVGGGGAGSDFIGGGGGAGGFRMSNSLGLPTPTTSPLASPTGLTVTAQTYPVTVGAGSGTAPNGNNITFPGRKGSDSVFSTITSAGGGGAGYFEGEPTKGKGGDGGSGGGADYNCWPSPPVPGGSGNTPPVSPPQGNNGGTANVFGPQDFGNGGGGGAGAVGGNVAPGSNCAVAGSGGVGSFVSPSFAVGCAGTTGPVSNTRYFAGGGGAGRGRSYHTAGTGGAGGGGNGCTQPTPVNGTANTGGGGGGATYPAAGGSQTDGSGGKGIVMIRYKFQ